MGLSPVGSIARIGAFLLLLLLPCIATADEGIPPQLTKSFEPFQLAKGRTSKLKLQVTNPSPTVSQDDVELDDLISAFPNPPCIKILPGAVEYDPPSCKLEDDAKTTITYDPPQKIHVHLGHMLTSETCTVIIPIEALTVGSCVNYAGPPTSSQGIGVQAQATLTITEPQSTDWLATISQQTSVPANWSVTPADAMDAAFGSTPPTKTITWDTPITFNLLNFSDSYQVNSTVVPQPISPYAGILNSGSNTQLAPPIVLNNDVVVTGAGGTLTLDTANVNAFTLHFDVASNSFVKVNGSVSGTGNLGFVGHGSLSFLSALTASGSFFVRGGFLRIDKATTPNFDLADGGILGAGTSLFSGTTSIGDNGELTVGDGTSFGTVPLTNLTMSGDTASIFVPAGSEVFAFGTVAALDGRVILYFTTPPTAGAKYNVVDSTGGHLTGTFRVASSNLSNVVLTTQYTSTTATVTVAATDRGFHSYFESRCLAPPVVDSSAFATCP